jgi:DNA-directed RNA polymerase subunit RPC12/RpoP
LPELNKAPGVLDVSMLVGYVWADEPRSSASVVVTGTNPAAEEKIAKTLAHQYWNARREFNFGDEVCSLDDCIAKAMKSSTHPFVLADSGDNPTGGGNGDQATVLEALLKAGAKDVVFGGIADRPAVDACYKAGLGKTIPLSIGATLDPLASKPVKVQATVKALLDEKNSAKREAAVQIQGITLILSAYRRPYPVIRTLESVGATLDMRESTVCRGGEVPTISSNIDARSISSRNATFSFWSRCSTCFRSSISVAAAYQHVRCPCSSRIGLKRRRNQRYCPSFLLFRSSISYGNPLRNPLIDSFHTRSVSCG